MERIAMKIDIKKIWNKHFGIEEEQQLDTTPRGFDKTRPRSSRAYTTRTIAVERRLSLLL
jgi:hypothetical protein